MGLECAQRAKDFGMCHLMASPEGTDPPSVGRSPPCIESSSNSSRGGVKEQKVTLSLQQNAGCNWCLLPSGRKAADCPAAIAKAALPRLSRAQDPVF